MANRYSHFDTAHAYTIQKREQGVLRVFRRVGMTNLNGCKILEVGCGDGFWLADFVKWGADPKNITGIDIDQDRVVEARKRVPVTLTVDCGNGASLPYPDNCFDIVLQSTVFTSLLDSDMRRRVASEMKRVVSVDGVILWYDFFVNNPKNPHVRRVGRGELRQLFSGYEIRVERITLAPPLARFFAPWSVALCAFLEIFPFLRTHYLATIRKSR